jgi:hypothetical protein
MPGGMLLLSANGSTEGSGILWAAVPLDGHANTQRGVKGIVLALSEQFSMRDRTDPRSRRRLPSSFRTAADRG